MEAGKSYVGLASPLSVRAGWAGDAAGSLVLRPCYCAGGGGGAGDSPYIQQSYTYLSLKLNEPRTFHPNSSLFPTPTVNCPYHQYMHPDPPPSRSPWVPLTASFTKIPLTDVIIYIPSPILRTKVVPTSNRSASPILQSYSISVFSQALSFFVLWEKGRGVFVLLFVQNNYK